VAVAIAVFADVALTVPTAPLTVAVVFAPAARLTEVGDTWRFDAGTTVTVSVARFSSPLLTLMVVLPALTPRTVTTPLL
jgi:hypothetical protein